MNWNEEYYFTLLASFYKAIRLYFNMLYWAIVCQHAFIPDTRNSQRSKYTVYNAFFSKVVAKTPYIVPILSRNFPNMSI